MLQNNIVRAASFDIGHCNFAQYVEDFNKDTMLAIEEKYKALPKHLQRRVKGPMNSKIEELILETTMCGTRVTTGVYDFTTSKGQGLDIPARRKLLEHLARFEYIWKSCDVFIIEQQYFNTSSFKGQKKSVRNSSAGANVDAIKVGEALFMWLLERYPETEILYFGSQNKTQILGAPWKMTKPERKKWSTAKAKSIYIARGDQDMIKLFELAAAVKGKRVNTPAKIQVFLDQFEFESDDAKELAYKIIKDKQKLDDIGDTCTQLQAAKFKFMVACF